MSRRAISSILVRVSVLVILNIFVVALTASETEAQQAPFLISPYYGTENINSLFDHEYPTYYYVPNGNGNPGSENNIFTRYDGARWTNPPDPVDKNNCTTGVNCYDGHDGYDFSLVYERVLAAASGQVAYVGWANPSDRTKSYGLYVRINHTNGYETRYGHLSAAAVSGDQQVLSGQVIGTSGNTGSSIGPHLHFEVRHNGQRTDPFGWSGGYTDPWQSYSGETSICLWLDGQWANICGGVARPIPAPADGTTIIVDDQGAGFSKGCATGSFWYEANAGYNNHMWWTYDNDTVEDCWGRWNPPIPQQGIYEVWVHIPNVNATTWQAPYTIFHYDGQNTASVDQYGLNNQWVSIGVYRFHEGTADFVRVTDATGETGVVRKVGVDAVKFVRRAPTYLPDVRINYSGWNSTIMVRSNGGNAVVDVKFYDENGGFLATRWNPNLAGHGVWEVPLPGLSNFFGSVVLDASQDTAVVVTNRRNDEMTAYNGILPAGSVGDPGWEQTGSTLYAPMVKKSHYNRSSYIYVLNAGTSSTTVHVLYYAQNGYTFDGGTRDLPPGASNGLNPFSPHQTGSWFTLHSAVITSWNGQMSVPHSTDQAKDRTR